MRYLIAVDKERGEGVLCTETGIALRYLKREAEDLPELIERLTEKMPVAKRQTAIHICLGDRADGAACDRLEEEVKKSMGEKLAVLCEDRMVHRIYSAFEKDEDGIVLYVSPDAGAGSLYEDGLAVLGGMGAPVYSEGSAFDLSVKTIRAALSAAENMGPPTVLTTFLEEAFGLPAEEIKYEIPRMAEEKIAAYARLAAKGKQIGDGVSVKLWNETVTALSRYVFALSPGTKPRKVKLTETPKSLEPLLVNDLSACLGDRFTVSASAAPILLGGIKRCAEMLGILADDTFCRTFLETYNIFTK